MATNLTATFAAAEAQVVSLLASSGTTVDLYTVPDPAGGQVDPVTLLPVAATRTVVASAVPALLVLHAGREERVPARRTRTPDALLVVGPGVTAPARAQVEVTACADPALVGARFVVLAERRSSAGVAALLDLERVKAV